MTVVTGNINLLIPFLDNPRLIDKFGLITTFSGDLKGYAKGLTEYSRDNEDIINIEKEIDDIMNYINEFWELLLEEIDHK